MCFLIAVNVNTTSLSDVNLTHVARLGFTSNNTIPPTSASAPTAGGMKCVSVVSTCIPRKLTGFPGVLKERPEYASTTTPKATRMTAMMVFVFI